MDGSSLVLNNIDSKPTILRNVTEPAGHWLELRLVGDVTKKSERRDWRDRLCYHRKLRQRQDVVSGTSYASQNDFTVHFGLGTATSIDKLEIQWPNGTTEQIGIRQVDRKVTVTQGSGVAR